MRFGTSAPARHDTANVGMKEAQFFLVSPCPRERHPHCSPSSEQRYAQEMHDLSANVLCCKKLLTITWAVSGSQSCCYWGSGRDSHGCRPVRLATAAACVVGSFLTTPASSPRPRSSHPGVSAARDAGQGVSPAAERPSQSGSVLSHRPLFGLLRYATL